MEEQEDKPFIIRTYTKVELAMLYNPGQCVTVALQTLSRWIRMNKMLTDELNGVGYNKFRRSFTPKEVSIIVKYMGEP